MSSTPREIGTLIVVVLKANHLPNKRHIGKQDPYCLVTVNGEKRRTKAIKRGGQHPEWDEEIRFTLYEDTDDVLERTANKDGAPPLPPPKDSPQRKKIKGGKKMKVACYADDPREPDLIGEADVDLTEVLTKGETDEWFTLTNKDKFAGKVYLELTFWSNEPAPEKKMAPKPTKTNKQYGGPGSFVPSGERPIGQHPSRIASASGIYDHSRHNSDSTPASLRASTSAQLDLYVAPYEQQNRISQMDRFTQDFSEFGVAESHRRRESFPPLPGGYAHRPQSSYHSYHPQGYEQSYIDGNAMYPYDRPVTPTGHQVTLQTSISGPPMHSYSPHGVYQPPFDPNPSVVYQSTIRGPRHSIPTSSSGFVPLPQSSGFVPLQPPLAENSTYASPVSQTPTPMAYNNPPQFVPQQAYAPPPSQTPLPNGNDNSFLPSSPSGPFAYQQPMPSSQPFGYPQYQFPTSVSAPQQQYIPTPQAPPVSLQATGSPLPPTQAYQAYPTSSPSHDSLPPLPQPPTSSANANIPGGAGSRPLPQQPQILYTQQPLNVSTIPQPSSSPQQLNTYSPSHHGNASPGHSSYTSVPPPPPPPPPPLQYTTDAQGYANHGPQPLPGLPLPPPPPPPPVNGPLRRHVSLPQPPVYQQPPPSTFPSSASSQLPINETYMYGHAPPPPPPPPLAQSMNGNHNLSYLPGPPPKPPIVLEDHSNWSSYNTQ